MLRSSKPNVRCVSAPSAASAGTMMASSARPGMVWIRLVMPSSGVSSVRRRATAIPSGTAIATASSRAASVSWRCAVK